MMGLICYNLFQPWNQMSALEIAFPNPNKIGYERIPGPKDKGILMAQLCKIS